MSDPNTSSKVQSAKQNAPELDAQTNAEIEAAMAELGAMGDEPAGKGPALGGKAAIRGPRVVQAGREHRTGTVVSVGPTDIFVEFGPKELGVAPKLGWPEDQLPKAGEQIELVIDRYESGDNVYVCSRPGAVQKADWELLEAGQVIEARVSGVVKGGLELEVAGHRAFMPAGQVSLDRVEDQSVFVNEKFKCKVIRVDRAGRGNIVLSRREVLIEERKANAEQLKGKLAEGMTIEGVVRKIMPFGAFVDLGGLDGLIHISDLSHDRVGFGEKAVAKHVQEGQKVSVKILKLDLENDRISLGLKQTMADPFAQAAESVQEGAQLTGRVTKILEFGAFVEITSGVEGLVHISEIDYKRINSVGDALKVDEVVQVKVLKIDPGTRRISLSIKATKEAPKREGDGEGKPGGRPDRKGAGGRTAEEILKETPALRRMREKAKNMQFKGGLG